MKIGVFGGTFDPPHISHIVAGNQAIEFLGLDKLIVVPARANPLKGRNVETPDLCRFEMTQIAFRRPKAIPDPLDYHVLEHADKFEVSDIEMKRTGLSYTSDTLDELQADYPNDQLLMIAGDDVLESLPRWHRIEHICQIVKIAVLPRKYGRNKDERHKIVASFPDYLRNALIFMDMLNCSSNSSTDIRDHWNDPTYSFAAVVDPKVQSYISEHKLYC